MLALFINAIGGVVFAISAAPIIQAELKHRQNCAIRAAWQCRALDPYPVRTRRRRLFAALVVIAILAAWSVGLVLVARFG